MGTPSDSRTERLEAGAGFLEGIRFTGSFHMGESPVHVALEQLVRHLEALHVPYAVVGAMALNAFGYRRATVDIDVLLTADGLARFKAACLGRGYVDRFPGSRGVRDTVQGVPIDFLLAGEYPGDGKRKPVRFPDPAAEAISVGGVFILPLERLIELKLASGMSAPHRIRDLADILELIRVRHLDESFASRLAPYVRDKYLELWRASLSAEPEEPG